MKKICEYDKCTGCGACYNICQLNAIEMRNDKQGFKKPAIDDNKCVKCGLCKKICPAVNKREKNNKIKSKSYAMYITDDIILKKSSSGGMFYSLAEYFIEELHGVVFGAIYDNNNVKIVSATCMDDVLPMMGSKYVYSDTGYTYREVKKYLEEERFVLYTGLPCQIAGLLNYLEKKYDTLITAEILCHGAPSQAFFNKYIEEIERRYSSKIKKITQRDSSKRWDVLIRKIIKIEFENGKQILRREDWDLYMSFFIRELSYNDSCYKCQYANSDRIADITLGDYGGLGTYIPFEKKVTYGVSFVSLNSKEAYTVVDKLKNVYKEERPSEEIGIMNSAMIRPTKEPKNRGKFKKDYCELTEKELFTIIFIEIIIILVNLW